MMRRTSSFLSSFDKFFSVSSSSVSLSSSIWAATDLLRVERLSTRPRTELSSSPSPTPLPSSSLPSSCSSSRTVIATACLRLLLGERDLRARSSSEPESSLPLGEGAERLRVEALTALDFLGDEEEVWEPEERDFVGDEEGRGCFARYDFAAVSSSAESFAACREQEDE